MLEYVGIRLLADLTLELLPVVRCYIFSIFFHVFLGCNPILKAFKVN